MCPRGTEIITVTNNRRCTGIKSAPPKDLIVFLNLGGYLLISAEKFLGFINEPIYRTVLDSNFTWL